MPSLKGPGLFAHFKIFKLSIGDKKNYGFWLDTNMKYEDFEGEPIEKEKFEKYWSLSGVEVIQTDLGL